VPVPGAPLVDDFTVVEATALALGAADPDPLAAAVSEAAAEGSPLGAVAALAVDDTPTESATDAVDEAFVLARASGPGAASLPQPPITTAPNKTRTGNRISANPSSSTDPAPPPPPVAAAQHPLGGDAHPRLALRARRPLPGVALRAPREGCAT